MFGNSWDRKKLCTPVFSQSLTGMVRARLPEVKFAWGLEQVGSSLKHSLGRSRWGITSSPMGLVNPHSIGQSTTSRERERTDHLPPSIGYPVVKAGSPTGRESYGDGVPIVVSDRESLSQGEGEQVRLGRKWLEVCGMQECRQQRKTPRAVR
ncbi:MAG: hypothetical protein ACE5OZ_26130 [Candidatus Heimdallarchaeota archaeon]